MTKPAFIPRPMVRTNQWVIVLSVLATWITHQAWVLWIPLGAGLLGLFFGFNPIMRIAKLLLRKKPSEYIPEDPAQQQFNQTIAIVCFALALVSFALGLMVVAQIFLALVGLAAFVAILGFCVGCFIRYQWSQFRFRRKQRLRV